MRLLPALFFWTVWVCLQPVSAFGQLNAPERSPAFYPLESLCEKAVLYDSDPVCLDLVSEGLKRTQNAELLPAEVTFLTARFLQTKAIHLIYMVNLKESLAISAQLDSFAQRPELVSEPGFRNSIQVFAHLIQGNVFNKQRMAEEATQQFFLAEQAAEQADDPVLIGRCKLNKASTFFIQSRMEEHETALLEAFAVFEKNKKYTYAIRAANNLAEFYCRQQDWPAAAKHLDYLERHSDLLNGLMLANFFNQKSQVATNLNQIREALAFAKTADSLTRKMGVSDVRTSVLDNLSVALYNTGDEKGAFVKKMNAASSRDSMELYEHEDTLHRLQTAFMNRQKSRIESREARQRAMFWVFLLGFGSVGLMVFWKKQKRDISQLKTDNDSLQVRLDRLLEARFSGHGEAVSPLPVSADARFLERLFENLENRFPDEDFDVAKLAQEMAVSRTVLYEKTKILTGLTPAALLKQMRLRKARHLLRTNQGTIKEVAFNVGFKHAGHFSREFQALFGVAPSRDIGAN